MFYYLQVVVVLSLDLELSRGKLHLFGKKIFFFSIFFIIFLLKLADHVIMQSDTVFSVLLFFVTKFALELRDHSAHSEIILER